MESTALRFRRDRSCTMKRHLRPRPRVPTHSQPPFNSSARIVDMLVAYVVIMDNGPTVNGDKCFENCEPYIIINNKLCKVLGNKNGIKLCEILKFKEILEKNNVSCLDLSSSLLLEFPSQFCSLDYLTELNISGNELQALPDEFINIKKMRILNISNNRFKEFPSVLYKGLHLIKKLNFSNNKITLVSKTPCCLPKLQHLDLSSNILVEPPCWLVDDLPSCLEYVDLSNNPCFELFTEFSDSCSRLKVADHVKTLKISNCMFREGLSSYILNFSNLHTLEVGNNSMRNKFPNYLSDLKSISSSVEQLVISNVGLANVSNSITNLTNLRYLDISYNMIHWLPASVKNLNALVILRADSCNLCLLPCEMNQLTSLKELYLSLNQLSSAEGFENLINLEILDLYGNQLICLPDLHEFAKLIALDLCQNYIEPPPYIEVDGLKKSYEDLKFCMRSKIKNCNRKDGAMEFSTIPEDEMSEGLSDYSLQDDFNDPELEDLHVMELKNSMSDCFQDSWEEDENENFDPNVWITKEVVHISRKGSCDSLTGETPYEVTTHPHYYTPFRLVTSIVSKNSLPPPVEGQFDD